MGPAERPPRPRRPRREVFLAWRCNQQVRSAYAKRTFAAHFTTARSSSGGAEAINGIIELHRRIARGTATPTTAAYACSSSPAAWRASSRVVAQSW